MFLVWPMNAFMFMNMATVVVMLMIHIIRINVLKINFKVDIFAPDSCLHRDNKKQR